ncbi:MAG: hypothetical protein RBU37_05760 [Myxococcota bacterium]|nr:hypothetical protein [Myxococcota bacterium]
MSSIESCARKASCRELLAELGLQASIIRRLIFVAVQANLTPDFDADRASAINWEEPHHGND